MNARPCVSRFVTVLLFVGVIFSGLALMAFSVPTALVSPHINSIALQQSTITPTITATVQTTDPMAVTPTLTITATPTLTPTLDPTSTPMPTPTPSGESPEAARQPDGSWGYIPANSKIWYAMTDSRMKLEVWLDANGQQGVSLFVYAPEQKELWTAKPIGQGTRNKLMPEHDLFWAGRTTAYGKWHVLVQNNNPFSVNFSINFDRVATRVADRCAVCHGYDISFDGCEDRGSQFCEGLEDEFKH